MDECDVPEAEVSRPILGMDRTGTGMRPTNGTCTITAERVVFIQPVNSGQLRSEEGTERHWAAPPGGASC